MIASSPCLQQWLRSQAAFRNAVICRGFIDARGVQQILAAVCEFYTAYEICTMMARLTTFEHAMDRVHSKVAQHTLPDVSDSTRIRVASLLAWIASARPRSRSTVLERKAVQVKANCISLVSAVAAAWTSVYNRAHLLNGTGLLSASLLAPLKARTCHIDCNFSVGDVRSDTASLTAYIQLQHALTQQSAASLPNGTGLAITLDCSIRDSISDEQLRATIKAVQHAVDACLLSELQRHGLFQDITVTATTAAASGDRCLRVQCMLRSQADIDSALKRSGTGLHVHELIPDFLCQIDCSASLNDIFESSNFSIADSLGVSVKLQCAYASTLIVRVMQELLLDYDSTANAASVKNSSAAADGNRGSSSATAAAAAAAGDDAEYWLSKARHAIRLLDGTKAASFDIKLTSWLKLLGKYRWLQSKLPQWLTKRFIVNSGCSAEWFKQFKQALYAEIASAAADSKSGSSSTSTSIRHQSQNSDHESATATATAAVSGKLTPLGKLLDLAKHKQAEATGALLEAFLQCTDTLIGIQSISIQTGSSSLTAELQGLDIFELLRK